MEFSQFEKLDKTYKHGNQAKKEMLIEIIRINNAICNKFDVNSMCMDDFFDEDDELAFNSAKIEILGNVILCKYYLHWRYDDDSCDDPTFSFKFPVKCFGKNADEIYVIYRKFYDDEKNEENKNKIEECRKNIKSAEDDIKHYKKAIQENYKELHGLYQSSEGQAARIAMLEERNVGMREKISYAEDVIKGQTNKIKRLEE